VRITIRHLKVFNDFAFIPDVIPGRHYVDAEIEKLFRQRRRDAEASRGILAVGNDQIGSVLLAQFRQAVLYDGPPGAPENVAYEKNFQNQVSGFKS
jgi:hypothetical protein